MPCSYTDSDSGVGAKYGWDGNCKAGRIEEAVREEHMALKGGRPRDWVPGW